MHIHGILLAAGFSRRLGRPKQGLSWQGRSLLDRAIDELATAVPHHFTVVLREDLREDPAKPLPSSQKVLLAPSENLGMGSSLAAGIKAALRDPDAQGFFIFACDQPLVDRHTLRRHHDLLIHNPRSLVVSRYDQDTFGIPVTFPRHLAPQLLQLHGEKGAKSVIEEHRDSVIWNDDEQAAWDIDTEADWQRWLALQGDC